MAFKVYTKTGDKGLTSLYGGTRIPKSHIRIEAYGTIDELNSFMGLLNDQIHDNDVNELILEIQKRLFTIGANLSTANDKHVTPPDIIDSDIELLENSIDNMEATLPPLKSFILPGGHETVSNCHIARTICRRAERRIIAIDIEENVEPIIIKYVNRLSDYLFVLGRKVAMDLGVSEIEWHPREI